MGKEKKKKKPMSKKAKKWLKIIATVLALFIIYNIFWLIYVNVKYDKYSKIITNENGFSTIYPDGAGDKNNYSYYAAKPNYPSLNGNLAIGAVQSYLATGHEYRTMQDSAEPMKGIEYDLLVWLKFGGRRIYLITVYDYSGEVVNDESVVDTYQFYIDENMDCYSKNADTAAEEYKNYRTYEKGIREFCSMVDETWDIFNEKN